MISNSIVISSILLAAAFWIAWLTRRDVRQQLERPKHEFQAHVQQYDQLCRNPGIGENEGQ
jgi:hypothetical protein